MGTQAFGERCYGVLLGDKGGIGSRVQLREHFFTLRVDIYPYCRHIGVLFLHSRQSVDKLGGKHILCAQFLDMAVFIENAERIGGTALLGGAHHACTAVETRYRVGIVDTPPHIVEQLPAVFQVEGIEHTVGVVN